MFFDLDSSTGPIWTNPATGPIQELSGFMDRCNYPILTKELISAIIIQVLSISPVPKVKARTQSFLTVFDIMSKSRQLMKVQSSGDDFKDT